MQINKLVYIQINTVLHACLSGYQLKLKRKTEVDVMCISRWLARTVRQINECL